MERLSEFHGDSIHCLGKAGREKPGVCAPNQRHWFIRFAKAAETGKHCRHGEAGTLTNGRVAEKLKHGVLASRIDFFLQDEQQYMKS